MTRDTKFKETELGAIPAEWEVLPFCEAVNFNPKRELKKGQQTKFVAMADIHPFTKKISGFSIKNFSGGTKFKNGDTLMARITPCLENGKTAFVDFLERDEVAGGSTEFIVLSGKDNVSDSDFVYYLTISQEIRQAAMKAMTGTSGRQRVETDKLASYLIQLPPLNEQHQIAEILSSLDDKIELNRKINANLEKMASALFKKWFVDVGDELLAGWKMGKLGEVINIVYGKGLPTDQLLESGYPVFGGNGVIGFYDKYLYNEPQIIIGCRGAGSGNIKQTYPKSFVTNNSLVLEIPSGSALNRFYLKHFLLTRDISEFVTGSAQPQITIENLRHLTILVPPGDLLNKFSDFITDLDSQSFNNELEIKSLGQIRDSL